MEVGPVAETDSLTREKPDDGGAAASAVRTAGG